MKKQQVIVTLTGLLIFTGLYFFGNTLPPKKKISGDQNNTIAESKSIEAKDILAFSKSRLTPNQLSYVNRLENAVVRGDVNAQQLHAFRQLADFWRDSVKNAFLPTAYYTGKAAKLENSEKSLTFAAQLFLENIRGQENPALKTWMANEAKELFQNALQLNPNNDSLKIGLGASYIFGSTAGNPQEVMQGIQQILEVARKDSTNMYAQFMLGLGGIESGQFDKAIERLNRVIRSQPGNLEAILTLADAYEKTGNKQNAVEMYQLSKKLIKNPDILKEIDQRINSLK